MTINSVFRVADHNYVVSGCGQPAADHIRAQFPATKILFMGFMYGDKFVPFVY